MPRVRALRAVRSGPAATAASICQGAMDRASITGRRSRRSARRSTSRTPKTARMMTSSVTAAIRGASAKGRWRGQVATSRSAIARTSAP